MNLARRAKLDRSGSQERPIVGVPERNTPRRSRPQSPRRIDRLLPSFGCKHERVFRVPPDANLLAHLRFDRFAGLRPPRNLSAVRQPQTVTIAANGVGDLKEVRLELIVEILVERENALGP